jgi:hypothetical protein
VIRKSHLWQQFEALPPAARRQVEEFIAFLSSRGHHDSGPETAKSSLSTEPFVGLWRDRGDLRDSTEWVRRLRADEWSR